MKEPRRNWTFEDVSAALLLYLRTDFGRFSKSNPDVILLAKLLDRTPSAVALKLSNLAALDETLPQKGMANASAMDRTVWAQFLAKPLEIIENSLTSEQTQPPREGTDRMAATKVRVGQDFFREMILTNYKYKCALTGISDPQLLNASHIVGWAASEAHRLNPRNGLCLNALHDRAFDRHLISFDDTQHVMISQQMSKATQDVLLAKTNGTLTSAARFTFDPALMAQHRQTFLDLQG